MVSLTLAISAGNHNEYSWGGGVESKFLAFCTMCRQLANLDTEWPLTLPTVLKTGLASEPVWSLGRSGQSLPLLDISNTEYPVVQFAVSSLCYLNSDNRKKWHKVPMHFMKAYRVSICIAPLILNFRTRRRWVVIISPSLFSPGKRPRCPMNMRLFGPQRRFGLWVKREISCLWREWNQDSSVFQLVTN